MNGMSRVDILSEIIEDRRYDSLIVGLLNSYQVQLVSASEMEVEDGEGAARGTQVAFGKFDDIEKFLIVFFHELGHTLMTSSFARLLKYNTYLIELECWYLGLHMARKHNIFFSDETITWGLKKAMAYEGNDERELVDWAWEKRKEELFRWKDAEILQTEGYQTWARK